MTFALTDRQLANLKQRFLDAWSARKSVEDGVEAVVRETLAFVENDVDRAMETTRTQKRSAELRERLPGGADVAQVLTAVAAHMNVPIEIVYQPCRVPWRVRVRYVACAVLRGLLGLPYEVIGLALNTNHSTAIRACLALDADAELAAIRDAILAKLPAAPAPDATEAA